MTKNQELLRKQLLARIHTHPKHKLLKSQEAWGSFLLFRFGEESSSALSIKELFMLCDLLSGKIADWEEKMQDWNGRAQLHQKGSKITPKQRAHIEHLRIELGWNLAALMRFVKRQTGEFFLNLDPCTKEQGQKIITGLRAVLSMPPKNPKGSA